MINIKDYFLGLFHHFINDQLNIVYVIKFSSSDKLDVLRAEIKKKISELNRYYRKLYSPYLQFTNSRFRNRFEDVILTENSKHNNLDLEDYEFIRLDYEKSGKETEFIFTVSHIIMDGISILAAAYYLLHDYSVDRIISYIDYPKMKKRYGTFLKENPPQISKLAQIAKYIKRGKSGEKRPSFISLKKEKGESKSIPSVIKTTIDLSAVRKIARKYKINRENYLTLKLVETIFRFCPKLKDNETCLLNLTKNIRLDPISIVDETLGNYSGRRLVKFVRKDLLTFDEYVDCYIHVLDNKTYLYDLIHEWHSLQALNLLPKALCKCIARRVVAKPSEGAPFSNVTASFSYVPIKRSVLFAPEFLKKMDTKVLEYNSYLRVLKQHYPCFVVFSNASDSFTISLTFNKSFMEHDQANKLLEMYKYLLMSG